MTIERIYKCTVCGELWFAYELHGPDTDLRCGYVTCDGSVVEVAQPLDGGNQS